MLALDLLLFIIHDYFLRNSYIFMNNKIRSDSNFKQNVLKGSKTIICSQTRIKTRNDATILHPFLGIMQQFSTLSEEFNQ